MKEIAAFRIDIAANSILDILNINISRILTKFSSI